MPTDPTKIYVIGRKTGGTISYPGRVSLYFCLTKGKRGGKQYWGNYIGTAGKRYGAERFAGGVALDRLLALNKKLVAVEVERWKVEMIFGTASDFALWAQELARQVVDEIGRYSDTNPEILAARRAVGTALLIRQAIMERAK